MRMAMPSIPKVFFMRTKQGEGSGAKRSEKSGRRRGREVGQVQGELWEKANSNAVVGTYLGGASSLICMAVRHLFQARGTETFRSVSRQCIRKNVPRSRYSLKREISGNTS